MKLCFCILSFLFVLNLSAQKIKETTLHCWYFQYPQKPFYPSRPIYSYYVTEAPDEINSNKRVVTTSMVMMHLKYSDVMGSFFNYLKLGIGDSGQLRLYINFSPFALEKRQVNHSPQQNINDMGVSMTYSYEVDFSLRAGVTLLTNDGRVVYHDTIIPKTLFHSNYPIGIPINFGDGIVKMPGYATQVELENAYLNQRSLYLSDMKYYYTNDLLKTIKYTMNDLFTYTYARKSIRFYTIKSKKHSYAELDSALNIAETAIDLITANSKQMDFSNWHRTKIKKMFADAAKIWEKDLLRFENKTDQRFTYEHAVHLKHNLMYAYYFMNDLAKVRQLWEEIHNYPEWGAFHKSDLNDLYNGLEKEELRYKRNVDVLELD